MSDLVPLLLYGVVFALPLLGIGAFCGLWRLLAQTSVVDRDPEQTPDEKTFSAPPANPHAPAFPRH